MIASGARTNLEAPQTPIPTSRLFGARVQLISTMRWPFRLALALVGLSFVAALVVVLNRHLSTDSQWLLIVYFLPTILAFMRKGSTNRGSVLFINAALGWTIIGWWVALGLAGSGSATRREA